MFTEPCVLDVIGLFAVLVISQFRFRVQDIGSDYASV